MIVHTLGHRTRSLAEFVALLDAHGFADAQVVRGDRGQLALGRSDRP